MIICSNCGATNNEADGHICRKCGALLPISNKTSRLRISTKKKEKELPKKNFVPKGKDVGYKSPDLDLQDIPSIENKSEQKTSIQIDFPSENIVNFEEQKEFLTEITPKPFEGSIIANKGIYGASLSMKTKDKSLKENILQETTSELESSVLKQKQLEKDMTKVLKFLSKKVTVKPLDELNKATESKQKPRPQIPPSSMNEILTNLLKLDVHIEASAIIQKDGTILASAISSRISDSLFGTIAQNLSMIGGDIVEGLNAGKLQNISIRGSEGVLDLAPIDTKGKVKNEMVLIILSHPKVKSGIIHLAANMVKKQVIQYLGLNK